MNEFLLLALIASGSVGGFLAGRLPMSGGVALGLALVPILGMWFTVGFCWGHPLSVLGPGITGAATPFALGYSLFARTRAANRPLSYTALVLCALEILVIGAFIIAAVFQVA